MSRKGKVRRKTKETTVEASLSIDGVGRSEVRLGERWYEHMVEALARYARFDVTLKAKGDLGHHAVEDAAIALGAAFREALGKRHVERIGSAMVAMDDALVTGAVDLVDRPYLDVSVPDEMVEHFLRSFAMEARITMHNIVHKGRNPHHVTEATMKALGLALRAAVRPSDGLVSTKGEARWKGKAGPTRGFR